ncbi:MAG: hypothetical protein E7513_04090 [Ruminococcaceae bacterium]|nr:hypothetical protein [Oscillospiraceae bacterium]
MKHKIIALVALIVSICALIVSVAVLVFNASNDLPNIGAFVFQVVAISLIVLLCISNFVYLTMSQKQTDSNDTKQ